MGQPLLLIVLMPAIAIKIQAAQTSILEIKSSPNLFLSKDKKVLRMYMLSQPLRVIRRIRMEPRNLGSGAVKNQKIIEESIGAYSRYIPFKGVEFFSVIIRRVAGNVSANATIVNI